LNRWQTTAFGGPQQAMCLTAEAANANKTAGPRLAAVIRGERSSPSSDNRSKPRKGGWHPPRPGRSRKELTIQGI